MMFSENRVDSSICGDRIRFEYFHSIKFNRKAELFYFKLYVLAILPNNFTPVFVFYFLEF